MKHEVLFVLHHHHPTLYSMLNVAGLFTELKWYGQI